MNETFKILAMYKNEDKYRLVVSKNDQKYEMVLKRTNNHDINTINMYSLTDDTIMTKEQLKEILNITTTFFEEEFGNKSDNRIVRLETTEEVLSDIKEKDIETYKYDYTTITRVVFNEQEVDFSKLNKGNSFPKDDDDFILSYENKSLINRRIYKLQRKNPISWDEYFMALSKLTSMRSKDPNTQVGACIVSPEHKILSIGYNGAPRGIDDDYFPWARSGNPLHTKYMYVCHAEMNAISNYNGPRSDFDGSTLYVDLFPCNECAKLIIQAGIKNVVYLSDKYANTEGNIASKRLFDLAGVNYRPLEEEHQKTITLSLNPKDK